jgi:copper chaperone NosL
MREQGVMKKLMDARCWMLNARKAPPQHLFSKKAIGFLIFAGLLLAACRTSEPRPVDILPEDMCAFCRMAISEKQYAAQFMRRDGGVFKFDDIGCMLNFVKAGGDQGEIIAFFVVDFETRQWTRGESAFYVVSAEFKTPMSHGVAAFKERAKAEAAASKRNGKWMQFAELRAN